MTADFYLHEDDWGMVSFEPDDNRFERAKILGQVKAFGDAHRAEGGAGWTELMVVPAAPIEIAERAIPLAALRARLGPACVAFDRVTSGYSSHVEVVATRRTAGRSNPELAVGCARMPIVGRTTVRCPACDREHDCELVQSINVRVNPDAKARLLEGELNVLDCPCGRRTQLAAKVLFHDPDADYWCQVCPGGEPAMADGELSFRAAAASGTQRLVPSLNALVEKVKLLDAGLDDRAIEMTKVLLLASRESPDLERVLLFERAHPDTIDWVLFEDGEARGMTSPAVAYTRMAARTQRRPGARELRIDRAWAIEAVRAMIADSN